MSNFKVGLGINKVNNTGEFFKSGHVISYIGSSIPNGWLLCDGSAISRTEYEDLWNVVKGSGSVGIYGNGNGTTTFNLPNFSNRFIYIGTSGSGGFSTHQHTVNATATAGVTGINHNHSNAMTGTGDLSNNHNHSGDANIGYNGTNPINANKTGTGGSGVANGGAHLHGAYSAAATNINRQDGHGHNVASFGLNSHYSEHGALHTAAVSGTSSLTGQVMPYYAVYFLVKI
jgi:microcystin-dependent protein